VAMGTRDAGEELVARGKPPRGCAVVCAVDTGVDASGVGTPVILYNNTGGAGSVYRTPSLHSLLLPCLSTAAMTLLLLVGIA